MKLAIMGLIIMVLVLASCTDEENSRRTLESAGFSEIQFTGYSAFECGKDDTYHTGFRAKNPAGRVVTGTVCCGMWTKGCTIRF